MAIFDCITTTAKEVFAQNSHPLVDTFIDELIAYGFPNIRRLKLNHGMAGKVNPAHITNIRSWLDIIGMKPDGQKG